MAANYIVAGTVGRTIHELMAGMVRHVIENDTDPITRGVVMNTAAVKTIAQLGRPPAGTETDSSEFIATHPLSFGRAGTIEYRSLGRKLNVDSPPMLSKASSYPSASTVPQRSTAWLQIGLKWLVGNLTIDRLQELALKRGAPIEDFLGEWVRDPIMTIHQQLTSDFLGAGYGTVAQVATGGGTTIASGASGDIILARNVRPFWRGQKLGAFDNNSGVPGSTSRGGELVVTKVHNFTTAAGVSTPTVTLLNNSASSITISSADWLVLKGAWDGTSSYGVLGLGYFTDNTISIHGLSKSTYPELKSFRDTPDTARNPVPAVFQHAFDEIHDRGFRAPTRVATTRGVRSLYAYNEGQFKCYNTDLSMPVQRGADGGSTGSMQFTTEDEIVTFEISAFVTKNQAHLYRPDALVRYAPEGVDAISFLGESPLLGSNMFLPSLDPDGNYTTVKEAPFDFFCEHGCLAPQELGFLNNLKELNDVMGT